jgi:hypothetical protein
VDALKAREVTPPSEPTVELKEVVTFLSTLWSTAKWLCESYAVADDDHYRFTIKPGKEVFSRNIDKWNQVFSDADQLASQKKVPERENPLPSSPLQEVERQLASQPEKGDEVVEENNPEEWEKDHPESFDRDGLSFFRFDINLIDVKEGQNYVSTVHNGVEYHAVVGSPSGPSKGPKSRGKTAVTAVLPGKPSSPSAPGIPVQKGKKDKEIPILARENPLKVKGEPKSKALSEEERKALRQFFKLEEGLVPPETWESLSAKQKAEELKKRSIPKWATEAVLRDPKNLQGILEGRITKDSMATLPRSAKSNTTKNSSAALEAWLQLKSDFKGTPLLKSPQTTKEKAFKKRFNALQTAYGEQACFPKLKDSPANQGGKSQQRGRTQGDLGGLIDLAKAFGEISRAFRG